LVNLNQNKKIITMIAIMSLMLFSALNQTIVGTAMPRIIAKLGGMEYYSWVFTIYMLTSSITVILVGKLSDIYGRKIFMLSGLAIFIAGSFLSGTSTTIFQLIVYRGIQGLGGGMIMSTSMTAVGDLFSPRERGRWQGLLGAVFGLASIAGPTVGGYIVDNLEWHWVFWVNLPVGVLAFILIAVLFPNIKGEKEPVDYLGALLLACVMVPLLLGFSWAGNKYDWSSATIIGLFATAFVALVFFVIQELKVQSPIIPMHLFRNSTFTISSMAGFLTGTGMFGSIMFIPLFVQGVIGVSATHSGYILIPMTIASIIASTLSGQISSRTGRYKLLALAGLAVTGAGMYLFSTMSMKTANTTVIEYMIITGVGLGLIMPVYILAVQNALPKKYLGVVTSSSQLFRSLGGTIGVSVMGTLMSRNVSSELSKRIPEEAWNMLPASQLGKLSNPQALLDPGAIDKIRISLPPQMAGTFEKILFALKESLTVSLEQVFIFGAAITTAAFLLTMFLKEIPLRDKEFEEEKDKAVILKAGGKAIVSTE